MSAKPRGQGLGAWGVDIQHRAGGEMIVRADVALGAYPDFITDRLEHWARVTPDQLFLAERGPDDVWREVTYAQALAAVRALGQALIDHDLGQDRPLAILSANDIDQALLTLAAQYVGVPAAPVSPPYSLIAEDFQRLTRVIEQIGPGLAFVAQGEPFAAAVTAATPPDLPVVVGSGAMAGRRTTPLAQLMATVATEAVDRRRDARRPDEIAKILFTSGSTGVPKGVINTHRMLASNQQMLRQAFAFAEHAPPVMLDWLPWHHTFGGNHNFGFALYNGGSFYIDDGRPTPGGIDRTVRNIKAVRPTVYLNVPRGFDLLLPRMARDAALTQALFERLEFLFYSGASLSAATWNGLRAASHAAGVGGLPIVTSLGATETAPACLVSLHEAEGPGEIGVPAPGVEVKLVPVGAKLELRLRGPHVTPGYWRRPELTASAFDEEGFYRIGDALSFLDIGRPERGFRFDGRLAEDFKLATGAWVDVGRLRARTMAALAPLVADVVIVGADRGDVGALLLPAWDACRAWIGEACDAPLDHPRLRRHLQERLAAMEARGSSERLIRAAFLREPLSLAAGEVTDKGSINARTVADRRSALVDALYADPERVGAVVLRSVAAG